MTKFHEWPDSTINLLVGGTPCQSFSVAGLRKGLDDPRGSLMLTYLAIARRYRPLWVVWENVPGVLSSNKGRDFGTFLGGLAELGYGFAYRVLDAQYIGVPQRRRRVFVVGYLGDWRRAAAVLFERHSLSGNPPPRKKAGEGSTHELAPCIGASGRGFERVGDTRGQDCVIPTAFHGSQDPCSGDTFNALGTNHGIETCVALPLGTRVDRGGSHREAQGNNLIVGVAPTLRAGGNRGGGDRPPGTDVDTCESLVPSLPVGVRRLTPRECERLQGFPDDYTLIKYGPVLRKKLDEDYLKYLMRGGALTPEECFGLAADGPRYKALGNSMAIPCIRWIGERIDQVSKLL